MENLIASVFSGVSQLVGKLLGHPLDFLSGKSCNTKCQPALDLFCYIENFCISHLLKMAMVIVLLYCVLLFFYLSFKLGICQCIFHTIWISIWACFATCFSMLQCCCTSLCSKLQNHNQRRLKKRARDIEELLSVSSNDDDDDEDEDCEGSNSSQARIEEIKRRQRRRLRTYKGREYKEEHLRRALRLKNHRVPVRLSTGDSFVLKKRFLTKNGDHHISSPIEHIKVTRSSKFARKNGSFKASMSRRRK